MAEEIVRTAPDSTCTAVGMLGRRRHLDKATEPIRVHLDGGTVGWSALDRTLLGKDTAGDARDNLQDSMVPDQGNAESDSSEAQLKDPLRIAVILDATFGRD